MNQRVAKKIRRGIKKMQIGLASELKGYINSLGVKDRIILAIKIIFKKEW
jgi:hypothetical protein